MIQNIDEIVAFRHTLHQHPEVSNNEKNTANVVRDFVERFAPDQVVNPVGGTGILFIYNGIEEGPTVAIRAELDALPIAETNTNLSYKSIYENVGHKCGHDGHMSMVAGLARWLKDDRPKKGRVILLFQPAEETGEGACRMLNDKAFKEFQPDYIFASHNLPGYPKGQIILKNGTFNAASKGIIIKLKGRTAHAAEPENGISPVKTVGTTLEMLDNLILELDLRDFALVTVVHAAIGEPAFGVSPDSAIIMATIRAYNNDDLDELEYAIRAFVKMEAETNMLTWCIAESERFRASVNNDDCVDMLRASANKMEADILEKQEPLRWSEDFGLFTERYKGAMFGIGAGMDTPDLHNPDYDFPDDIIPTGIEMYKNTIDQILNN